MKFRIPVTLILRSGLLFLATTLLLLVASCTPASSPKDSSGTPLQTDGAGLFLTVTEPQDNTITSADRIEVKGRTSPGATVSVNEEIASADNQGNFIITIGLDEGINTIEVFASDETGKETEVTLIVTVVTQ